MTECLYIRFGGPGPVGGKDVAGSSAIISSRSLAPQWPTFLPLPGLETYTKENRKVYS